MGRVVIDLFGYQRADDTDVVGHLGVPGEKVANPLSAIAVLLEAGQMPLYLECLALELRDGLARRDALGHRLAVHFIELRLVIEGLQMRRSARHAEKDDPLCLGGKVRQRGQSSQPRDVATGSRRRQLVVSRQQAPQGERTQAQACRLQERPAMRDRVQMVSFVHFVL